MTSHSPTPAQRKVFWLALTCLAVSVIISLACGLCWGLGLMVNLLSPVLWPLAVAGVVACVLAPAVDWLERRKLSRIKAIMVVYLAAFLVVGGILGSIIPQLVDETEQLIGKIPEYSDQLRHRLAIFLARPPEFLRHFFPAVQNPATPGGPTPNPTDKALASISNWFTQHSSGVGSWLFQQKDKVLSLFGVLAGLVLIPIYVFYFLEEREGIEKHWKEYLPVRNPAAKKEVVFVLESINRYLVAFFRGQVLVAICESILYTIGFECAGLNYGFLLGFAALFLTMIPFLGATILCALGLLLAFVQFGDWLHPVIVLGIVGLVQTLESFVISPKIIGDRVGLHPMVIIIAVIAGTTLLGGLLGGLLAIPLAAALRVILSRYVWKVRD
jgi:predicted PurR-regulated permease PerM